MQRYCVFLLLLFSSFPTVTFAEIAAKSYVADNFQPKVTVTGANNLLTAPTAAGGQPGTKAASDFATSAQGAKADNSVQKTGNETVGGVKTFSEIPIFPTATLPGA